MENEKIHSKTKSIFEDPTKLFDLMDIHGFILKSKKEYEFIN